MKKIFLFVSLIIFLHFSLGNTIFIEIRNSGSNTANVNYRFFLEGTKNFKLAKTNEKSFQIDYTPSPESADDALSSRLLNSSPSSPVFLIAELMNEKEGIHTHSNRIQVGLGAAEQSVVFDVAKATLGSPVTVPPHGIVS